MLPSSASIISSSSRLSKGVLLSLQGEARFTNYSFVRVCVSECVCREYGNPLQYSVASLLA